MINFHNAKSFCENFTAFLKCIAGFVTSLCSAECCLLWWCLRLPLSVRFCYMLGVALARLPFRGSIWAVWHAGSACFGGRHGSFCVVLPVLWRYCLCFSVLCLQPQAVPSLRKCLVPGRALPWGCVGLPTPGWLAARVARWPTEVGAGMQKAPAGCSAGASLLLCHCRRMAACQLSCSGTAK